MCTPRHKTGKTLHFCKGPFPSPHPALISARKGKKMGLFQSMRSQSDTSLPAGNGQPGGKFVFVVAVEVVRVNHGPQGSAWKLFLHGDWRALWLPQRALAVPRHLEAVGQNWWQSKGISEELLPANTQLNLKPFLSSTSPYESVGFVIFKAIFHIARKKSSQCDSFHFSFRVPHIPQPHLSNFRHYSHYFMTFLVAQHPLYLLPVLSRHHDSPPPIIHRHTHTSVPQFFC